MQSNSKYLLGLFVVLAIGSVFVIQSKKDSTSNELKYVVPELQTNINAIDYIDISKNENQVTLYKKEGTWRIKQEQDFFADANKIANLLLDLRKLKLKQKKTSNPDKFSQLSLSNKGKNAATLLKIKAKEQMISTVYFGKKANNNNGTYIRMGDENQSWLIDGVVHINEEKDNWLVENLINLDSTKIKSVSYNPQVGKGFSINKLTPEDKNFAVSGLAENQLIKTDIKLNDFAKGLEKFAIEGIADKQKFDKLQPSIVVRFEEFSGLTYEITLFKSDEKHLMKVNVINSTNASAFVKSLPKWLYVIPKYKYDSLNKKLNDILQTDVVPDNSLLEKKN